MGAIVSCLKTQDNDQHSYDRATVSTWVLENSENVLDNEGPNDKVSSLKAKPFWKKGGPCYRIFKPMTALTELDFDWSFADSDTQLLSKDLAINVLFNLVRRSDTDWSYSKTALLEIKNCSDFAITIYIQPNHGQESVRELNVKPNETIQVKHKYFDDGTISPFRIKVKSKYNEITQRQEIFHNFIKDLEQVLDKESFTDLILICEDQQIPCHKIILSARSPTFKKMIEKENFNGKIILDTMKFTTLGGLLKFMYTNKVLCDVDLPDLFVVANEYQMPDLQQKCKLLMLETMKTISVASIFHLAIKVQDDDLRKASMRYIIKNFEDVKWTEGWTILKQDSQTGPHFLDLLSSACSPLDTLAVLDLNKMKESISEYGSLFLDLAKAFEGQSNADIILTCQDVEFPCQSLMLRRSPVFKLMLEKSTDGKLLIENETPEVLKAVLKFLHIACVEVTSFLPDLHHAAKRYQIIDLLRVSTRLVSVSICDANALQYLKFGAINNDTTLRNEAMQYIAEHFDVIKEMPEWTELKSYLRDSQCLEELISIVCSKKKN